MSWRQVSVGAEDKPRKPAMRLFVGCWIMALAIHVAWIPNAVWFMAAPAVPESSIIGVSAVALAPRPVSQPRGGHAAAGRLIPEIQLPGAAPGGSSRTRALRRHEWPQAALDQVLSSAQRSPDHAVQAQPYRPQRPGRRASPAERVSLPVPGSADIATDGATKSDASLLRRRGERRRGLRDGVPLAGGSPSAGNRVPLDDGELSSASAGEGPGAVVDQARRGARPRSARPVVQVSATSADAPATGPLAGMQHNRQATPELAWSSAPVREARRASGAAERTDVVAGGRVARRRGQGSSVEARGPGRGGRGRGTDGSGRAQNSLISDYLRDSMARIHRHWDFPRELIYDLRQGIVVLLVRVRHDGRVQRVTVRRSSGFQAFDEFAVRAVHQANPLAPPPPEELFRHGRDYIDLPLEMRYRNPMFD